MVNPLPFFGDYCMIDNFKIYSVSDKYIDYLRKRVPSETDLLYKDLVQEEIIFIRKNKDKIRKNAELLYKQKNQGDMSAGYVKTALDYKKIEEICKEYIYTYL